VEDEDGWIILSNLVVNEIKRLLISLVRGVRFRGRTFRSLRYKSTGLTKTPSEQKHIIKTDVRFCERRFVMDACFRLRVAATVSPRGHTGHWPKNVF
jgi:hypothetical protein